MGRSKKRPAGPTLQYRRPVEVFLGVAVLTVVLVVALWHASLGVGAANGELAEVRLSLAEQVRKLDISIDAWARAHRSLVASHLGSAPVSPEELAAGVNARTEATDAWTRFRSKPAISPADEAARADIDRLIRAYEDQVMAVSAPGLADESARTALERSYAELIAALKRLELQVYAPEIMRRLDLVASESSATAAELRTGAGIAAGAGFPVALVVYAFFARRARTVAMHRYRTDVKAAHNAFDAELQIGLDRTESEQAVLELAGHALATVMDDAPSEFLLASSTGADFRRVAPTDPTAPVPGCGVMRPSECPAVRHAGTLSWSDSRSLDACSHLRAHTEKGWGGLCVPVTITGTSVGVLHAVTPPGRPPTEDQAIDLATAARKVGERLGSLRAFARSEVRARTDHLTGLLNRRSVEAAARELDQQGRDYVVAFVDIDHFKQLNDTYGHDVGDKALQQFAQVLRAEVRPSDVVARYGGEEFVLLLTDCTAAACVPVLQRVRGRLARTFESSGLPWFTASFGVAERTAGRTFRELVVDADANLLEAKARGRDCIVVPAGTMVDLRLHPSQASDRLAIERLGATLMGPVAQEAGTS